MICAILLVVASITISFAMVSTSLDIRGKMKMGSANWDIHFTNLKNPVINGNALEISKPYIADKSTSIVNLNVKLQNPNDSISYLFDVVNDGGLNAELSSIQIATPICTGSGEQKKEDAELVCNNIRYELMYQNGTKIKIGDILNSKDQKQLKLKLSYVGNQLPLNEVDVSNLSIAAVYSQR